jgi:hypothetical protein
MRPFTLAQMRADDVTMLQQAIAGPVIPIATGRQMTLAQQFGLARP